MGWRRKTRGQPPAVRPGSQRIVRGYSFPIKTTPELEQRLWAVAGCCRLVYNLCLEQRSFAWRYSHHSVGYVDQTAEITALKADYPWLKEVPSQALQQAANDLHQAFQNFFAGRARYPKRRKKYRGDSFRLPQGVAVHKNVATAPKLGQVRFVKTRKIRGRLLNTTISCRQGKWWIAFACEQIVAIPAPVTGPAVGIDLGVVNSLTRSDGLILHGPEPMLRDHEQLARLQRKLKPKQRGSQREKRLRARIRKLHAHMTNCRRDFLHKTSTMLAKSHGLIVIEDLHVRNMTASARGSLDEPGINVGQKSGLNRAILDQGWYELRRQLTYKAVWYGSRLVVVPAPQTSRRCSRCGHVSPGNRPTRDAFRCLRCGHTAPADHNAAKNILAAGRAVYARHQIRPA